MIQPPSVQMLGGFVFLEHVSLLPSCDPAKCCIFHVSTKCFSCVFGGWFGRACSGISPTPTAGDRRPQKRAEHLKCLTLFVCLLRYGKRYDGKASVRCKRMNVPWPSTGLLHRGNGLGHRKILRSIRCVVNNNRIARLASLLFPVWCLWVVVSKLTLHQLRFA